MIFFFLHGGNVAMETAAPPPQPLLPHFSHNSIKAVLTGVLSHVCSWCWCVSVALLELCTLSVCCRCPMMSVSIDTALLLHLLSPPLHTSCMQLPPPFSPGFTLLCPPPHSLSLHLFNPLLLLLLCHSAAHLSSASLLSLCFLLRCRTCSLLLVCILILTGDNNHVAKNTSAFKHKARPCGCRGG